jgi:hypothetical protein
MPVNKNVFYLSNRIYVYESCPFSCSPFLPEKNVQSTYFLVRHVGQIAYRSILEIEDGSP